MVEIFLILTSFQAGKVIFKTLATFFVVTSAHSLIFSKKLHGRWTNSCLKCISVTSESLDLFICIESGKRDIGTQKNTG